MKRKNLNRNALVTSIISLLLCVSMLVGTTFAWFTDEVTTGMNTIAAGNLDVELLAGNTKVDSNTKLFDDVTLWEPGVVVYENLQVVNVGTLALQYQMTLNFGNENDLAGHKLSEVLQVAVIDKIADNATRAQVLAAAEGKGTSLAAFAMSGTLQPAGDPNGNDKSTEQAVVIFWAPNDNKTDNLYNANNGQKTSDGEALHIEFGVNLQATQVMHEEDSFGKDYDALAGAAWDGTTGEVPAEEDGVITIYTGAELAALAESVNAGTSYAGKTVKLGADIDLDNKAWTPIGQHGDKAGFKGTFDGQGHTIYNLTVNQTTRAYQSAGLFGSASEATIKNFKIVGATINNLDDAGNTSNGAAVVVGAAQFATTIDNVDVENATVKSNRRASAIAGYFVGTITNCDVKNVNLTADFDAMGGNSYDNADKVGMIIAYSNGASTISNNTVTGGSISAYRDMGGIAGYATTSTLTNNKVSDLTIVINTAHNYKSYTDLAAHDAGEIIGEGTADATNTATNVTFVKGFIVSNADELAAALKSTDKHIAVTLANDIAVPMSSLGSQTPGSGEYKLAGEDTESIVIDLNENELTLTTGYMSAIGAKNADATITIKNGSMNSTGNSATTWNINDLIFANCNYEFEDVVFDKEVALTNTGKTATMKDVTINGTGDYYALWISARGQDVEIDGLTIKTTGRGIKIDEQYVDAPAKVTLDIEKADFNTAKKGAIMVKSAAGADITLSNVDIADTIDPVHAVWVDEDAAAYADKVVVNGGEVICEANVVEDATGLKSAVADGKTNLWLLPGEYDVDGCGGKTLTLSGTKDAVITVVGSGAGENGGQSDYGFDGSTVTFNGLTIKTNNQTYAGYVRMKGTYNNCVFESCYCLYDNSQFTDCTFNVSGDQYNVWTWGAPVATFTGCTFNSDGKAVLLYGQANTKLTLDTCTFNDKGGLTDKKAAVEIGNDYGKSYELIVNNTTVNDYEINDKGINTGTTLWGNKNSMGTDKLNVVVDGVDVY